jgi:hypothetical protein
VRATKKPRLEAGVLCAAERAGSGPSFGELAEHE